MLPTTTLPSTYTSTPGVSGEKCATRMCAGAACAEAIGVHSAMSAMPATAPTNQRFMTILSFIRDRLLPVRDRDDTDARAEHEQPDEGSPPLRSCTAAPRRDRAHQHERPRRIGDRLRRTC